MRQPSFGCRSDYVREHLYCSGASPPVARTRAEALFASGGFPAPYDNSAEPRQRIFDDYAKPMHRIFDDYAAYTR